MAGTSGMVVTDGRVMLGTDVEGSDFLAVVPRNVRVNNETMRSDERLNVIRSFARDAKQRGRPPQVLPPDRQHFLETYTSIADQHRHVVSMHLLGVMDGAAREARICRQLMQPYQLIDVYEAKTLEGGLDFLVRTATALTEEGASTAQLLTLLHYLETHMHTFLLTPAAAQSQPWFGASALQRMASMTPGNETLWRFDPKQRKLVAAAQGIRLYNRMGQTFVTRWDGLRFRPVVRHHGYSKAQIDALLASLDKAGMSQPTVEQVVSTFLPGMPNAYVELLLLPTEEDLQRLQVLVQDPIWWKGSNS